MQNEPKKTVLEFNVTGPCVPGKHYMLDPLRGIGDELMALIDSGIYFVLHAARQSGKTTLLQALINRINSKSTYYTLYCTLEAIQGVNEPEKGIPCIVRKIKSRIKKQGFPEGFAKDADYNDFSGVLCDSLMEYCSILDKPLVIFFDEADCLSNGTIISFLRQLREGYITKNSEPFLQSVALIGMRNIRDYRGKIRADSETFGSASPFNILKESLNLRNFTKDEVIALYAQHTAETGQAFEPQMMEFVFEQTQGQPWLVNAIACECVEKITKKNYSISITQSHAEQAIQNITRDRRTHIDSMMDRLKDPRVRNVLVPFLLGEDVKNRSTDDYHYTRDLGIIRENSDGSIEPGNPIYADMIIRTLNWDIQETIKRKYIEYEIPHYLKDGKLDMDFLIKDFQEFWRENSLIWKDCLDKELYQYEEAAPHLILYAFLQRIINGGGQVIREKASGTKRVDLCVLYEGQKYPIEIKILQNERSRSDSLKQTLEYMDCLGSDTGWLIIFDRNDKKTWDEKIYINEENINGKRIVMAGC